MPTRLIELVEGLPRSKVVLVGDLMVDKYIYGNAERLAPEAPVAVLHYKKEDARLGGAGRVAADLATLGAEVRAVGLLADDDGGKLVRKLLNDCGASDRWALEITERPTICKIRLVGLAQDRHAQQLMRLDYEDPSPIGEALAARVLKQIEKALDGANAMYLEDYNKGLLTPAICQGAIALAKARNIPIFVDPANIADYSKYKGCTAITPNRTETEKSTGLPAQDEEDYQPAAEKLLEALGLECAVLTLDRHGAYIATKDGERRWLTTRERKVYDVAGAGDMVLSMLALARTGGATWAEAVALSNIAGGLEVERFGSIPITRAEVIEELLVEARTSQGKQRDLDVLCAELNHHRTAGKKIVFTNGCFDLIHLGHVKYFQFAKQQGDILVVAVNTDSSIRRLKGDKRPIVNEQDRIGVLEELESIDYLVRFEQDTPKELIERIQPDVLVKGADYAKEQVVGWDIVEARGGSIALAPLIDGRSTSGLIQRIIERISKLRLHSRPHGD